MNDKISNEKQPFENFEELPCDIIDQETFDQEVIDDNDFIFVEVDVFVGKELGKDFQDAVDKLNQAYVARTTKRGTRFYAGDIEYKSKTGIIFFKCGTAAPSYFYDKITYTSDRPTGTTFADFCFLNSEGTKFHNLDQCSTPFRKDANPGDLTWLLPAKFVDDMVEMMSIMNNLILGGTMEESILYGPILI